MARLISAPQKFSANDWLLAKHIRFNRSENARLEADRLLSESNRIRDATLQLAHSSSAETNKKLEQRIDDVDYWRSEVNKRQVNTKQEIDHLNAYKGRLERAMEGLIPIMDINQQCFTLREQRQGIDLVHDITQENLLKERDVTNGVMNMYRRCMEQVLEQIRFNRKARYHLENDLCNKTIAMKLDNFSANLTPYSSDLVDSSGSQLEPYKSPSKDGRIMSEQQREREFTVHDWRKVTMAVLSKAEGELNHSLHLRGVADGILSQGASDLRYQVNLTNRAFEDRIKEARATKTKLEEEHAELERQVTAMELNIENLQKTVSEVERPLALAQTRLAVRGKRPDIESCQDGPQLQLLAEIQQLKHSLNGLLKKIRESELSLQDLLRNKLEVEDDIKIKSQTLYIDEVQCSSLRKSICIQQF